MIVVEGYSNGDLIPEDIFVKKNSDNEDALIINNRDIVVPQQQPTNKADQEVI